MLDRTEEERHFLRRVLIVLGVVVLLLTLWAVREAVLIAFAALLVAVMLSACADFISTRTGLGRRWALILSALLILAFLGLCGLLVGTQVASQVTQLINGLPRALTEVENRLGIDLPSGTAALPNNIMGHVAGLGRALVDATSALILAVVGGGFLAADPQRYRAGVVKLFPKDQTARVEDMLDTLGAVLRRYLLATLVAMVIIGTAAGLASWWLGLPAPLALGLFAGLAQFVPVIGAVVGAVPAVMLAAAQGGSVLLWTIGAFVVIQQVESNMITPVVEERLVNIPAFVLLLGIVAAGAVFGLPGVVLAAPITVVCFVVVQKLWVRETLERRVEVAGEGEA
ncbi:AI-2E family transporter [Sabulicella glaciei]|uniref:AI-2E family transporter n=1 Tax=Sabulicella glaciei TaxID=2984948 RepID=A0ABT3NQG8_9PROT|nr:AI-2E family transporter [Roseococcus sp. MDT2-1-1]MCW8084408.1 AI-2E family transporter [Roseococcus sp. MDT2-1-1]